jgi:D-apiose dehydrogenase
VGTTRMADNVMTLPAQTLRVALVGCGRISAYHLAALKEIAGVEVVAVCDTNPAIARECATLHEIRACHTDM